MTALALAMLLWSQPYTYADLPTEVATDFVCPTVCIPLDAPNEPENDEGRI
jgi:hypothetical protein